MPAREYVKARPSRTTTAEPNTSTRRETTFAPGSRWPFRRRRMSYAMSPTSTGSIIASIVARWLRLTNVPVATPNACVSRTRKSESPPPPTCSSPTKPSTPANTAISVSRRTTCAGVSVGTASRHASGGNSASQPYSVAAGTTEIARAAPAEPGVANPCRIAAYSACPGSARQTACGSGTSCSSG